MSRVAGRYTTLALPDSLTRRIDAFVQSNTWGYRNRGEVAAAAVREFLQRHAGQSVTELPKEDDEEPS